MTSISYVRLCVWQTTYWVFNPYQKAIKIGVGLLSEWLFECDTIHFSTLETWTTSDCKERKIRLILNRSKWPLEGNFADCIQIQIFSCYRYYVLIWDFTECKLFMVSTKDWLDSNWSLPSCSSNRGTNLPPYMSWSTRVICLLPAWFRLLTDNLSEDKTMNCLRSLCFFYSHFGLAKEVKFGFKDFSSQGKLARVKMILSLYIPVQIAAKRSRQPRQASIISYVSYYKMRRLC